MEVENAEKKAPHRKVLAPNWLGRRVGRFKLVALLGQGAMGRVFRAEDVQLQRQVALKVLPQELKRGRETIRLEQFVREARSAASLDHPGVVQVYEINESGDVFYIAMELLEGGNLNELVKASGPLDIIRACQLGAEAAEALGHAHQMGIIHRDVKPANLMLSRGGRCKLTDFGLARIDDPGDSFTMGSETVGTPLYMATEVACGMAAEPASDVYSLSATMCYLLCGRPPFLGRTAREILEQHVSAPIPDVREWRPDVPAGLAETISKGLTKRPKDRFASAEQFASALRVHTIPLGGSGSIPAVGSGSGSSASSGWKQNSVATPVPVEPSRQNRGVLIGVGAAAVLLIAGGIGYVEFGRSPAVPVVTVQPPAAQVSAPDAQANASATPGASAAAPTLVADTVNATAATASAQTVALTSQPATPLPLSPAEAPTAATPTSTISATDTATLVAIASNPKNPLAFKSVTVVGVPKKTHLTSSGNMRISFVGAAEDTGFEIFCPDTIFGDMKKQFGGSDGADILGHKIAVQGVVSMNKGRPQIRIESAKQITLMP